MAKMTSDDLLTLNRKESPRNTKQNFLLVSQNSRYLAIYTLSISYIPCPVAVQACMNLFGSITDAASASANVLNSAYSRREI